MGADLALGRPFSAGDRGSTAIAVISDALWKRAFGGAPDVLGRTLAFGGIAGLCSMAIARWGTTTRLKAFAVVIMPLDLALEWDLRTLGFLGLCIGVAIAFGFLPCARAARSADFASVLQAANTNSSDRRRGLSGRLILTGQFTICAVLLMGAGLLLRTVVNLRTQDLGYDRNVVLLSIAPGQSGYTDAAAAMLLQRVRARFLAMAGGQAVGESGQSLLDPTTYWIQGSQELITDEGAALPGRRWTAAPVGPGFFDAVGMKVVAGRDFEDHDLESSVPVVIINRVLAHALFGERGAVGLYGVRTADPWTIAIVAAVLLTIALVATLRPARAAAAVDPIALLRAE